MTYFILRAQRMLQPLSGIRMRCRHGIPFWLLIGILMCGVNGQADGITLESTGARFGFGNGSSNGEFRQADAVVKWNLPWRWDLGTNWWAQTGLEASAGWLGDYHQNGAIGSVGPTLSFSRKKVPVSLELGFLPALLGRSHYESKDFSIPIQFITSAGLNWDVSTHFRLGYRFHHMSNAGLSSWNPGMNMSMFGLFYRF